MSYSKPLKRHSLLLFFLTANLLVSAQNLATNMTLLGHWDNNSLPSTSLTYNEIWGYAANGREYAILGTLEGTYFIDITDPAAPVVADYEAGSYNRAINRDYQTYRNYCYAVGDQGGNTSSLQIFDLSSLPDSVHKVYQSNHLFATAHSIFINTDNGRMYVAGSNRESSGLMILNLSNTPESPQLLASIYLGHYVHDLYVRNDTAYLCMSMNQKRMEIYDFSNTDAHVKLAELTTWPEQGNNHSCWLTEDGKTLVFADETSGSALKVADVSDMNNISILSTFKSTLLAPAFTNSLPHNPVIKGRYAFVSYYHDGLQVFDISNPETPVLFGFYDTHPQSISYAGYRGCWGVYPYLPSGRIITSDTENGLDILSMGITLSAELIHFSAISSGKSVNVEWETASEDDLDQFIIERKTNGDFIPIHTISARGIANHYSYADYETDDQDIYYRLKFVDHDGLEDYSEVIQVNSFKKSTLPYPNPAQSGEWVSLGSCASYNGRAVELTKSDGSSITVQSIETKGQLHVRIPENLQGIYYLQMKSEPAFISRMIEIVN